MGWLLIGLVAVLCLACAFDDDDDGTGGDDMFDWAWPSQQRRMA